MVRAMCVGVAGVLVIAAASPGFGGSVMRDEARPETRVERSRAAAPAVIVEEQHCGPYRTAPMRKLVVEDCPHPGADFGLGLAAASLSLLYSPFRVVFGIAGAHLGGFGGWATGGDMRTARALWRPTVEGHYFIRPDHLDGRETFRFSGAIAADREHREYGAPITTTVHEREVVVSDEDQETEEIEPLEDDGESGAL